MPAEGRCQMAVARKSRCQRDLCDRQPATKKHHPRAGKAALDHILNRCHAEGPAERDQEVMNAPLRQVRHAFE